MMYKIKKGAIASQNDTYTYLLIILYEILITKSMLNLFVIHYSKANCVTILNIL